MSKARVVQNSEAGPAIPPAHSRSIRLAWPQWLGLAVFTLIPVLGLAGVFGENTRALDPILRIAFVYFFLMLAFRLMGKRELSEMSPFELVTLLLVPEVFSAALSQRDYTMTQATIGVATLFLLVFLTGLAAFRSGRVEQIVEGKPTILVHNGALVEANLKRERVTAEEVFSEMHKTGIETVDQVKWAILEADGTISIIPAKPLHGSASRG